MDRTVSVAVVAIAIVVLGTVIVLRRTIKKAHLRVTDDFEGTFTTHPPSEADDGGERTNGVTSRWLAMFKATIRLPSTVRMVLSKTLLVHSAIIVNQPRRRSSLPGSWSREDSESEAN